MSKELKCLSVQQHLPPGILPPWVGGVLCSSHLPLNSPKLRCRREGGRPAVVIPDFWLWLLAKVGKGER